MRTAREILRQHFEGGLSDRAIARSCRKSATTVGDIVRRFTDAGLEWPAKLSDEELEKVLFPSFAKDPREIPEPDWIALLIELKKHKGVTRKLLWQEYRLNHPDGYMYSQFCYHMDRAAKASDPVMRQDYRGGEKLFVDWAGLKLPYAEDGVFCEASLFVGALGASNYMFAEAYRDEKQANWNQAHVDCFDYMGGVPELVVPDNTKTGVTNPCYYEPDLNVSYHELAVHYNTAIMPARIRKPQDKAKVEAAVQIAEREIAAPLRKVTFHSLGELRSAVREKLNELNARAFSKLEGTRNSLFEQVDKPALKALPQQAYSMGEWSICTVFKDYHVQVKKHYYSVPWQHIGEKVEVRLSASVVEIFLKGVRIACHTRNHRPGKATTLAEHRPEKHNAILERSAAEYIEKAAGVGAHCQQTVQHTLDRYPNPEMGFRSCEGLLRLAKAYGHERMENACRIAVEAGTGGYRFINEVLCNGRDKIPLQPVIVNTPAHENVRGRSYYGQGV